MAPFNITIFLNVWGTFFLLQHTIFRHVPLIYNPKLKIFLDIEDDDNYDEGDNQPEKNITPKECLEALEFEPTANFMIFKIRSITASEWLRMIV